MSATGPTDEPSPASETPKSPRPKVVRRSSPCPTCDADLRAADLDSGAPTCPACGQRLLPARVAGIGRRLAAAGIDAAVLLLTAGPLALLLDFLVRPAALGDAGGLDAVLQLVTADFGSVTGRAAPFVAMATLYFALFWALGGRSLGQRVLRVRVVDGHGRPPSPLVGALRSLAQLLALLPIGLGAIWCAFDREKRTLHDHLTGTWVVEEGRT